MSGVEAERIRVLAGRTQDGAGKWKAYAIIGVDDQADWDALDGAFLDIPLFGRATYEEQIILRRGNQQMNYERRRIP